MRKLDPEVRDLALAIRAAGVKSGHAYDIATGRRKPSLGKALEILDAGGPKVGPLAGLSADEVETARRMAEAA